MLAGATNAEVPVDRHSALFFLTPLYFLLCNDILELENELIGEETRILIGLSFMVVNTQQILDSDLQFYDSKGHIRPGGMTQLLKVLAVQYEEVSSYP